MHANGSPTNGIRLNSVRRQADLVFERINRHAGHLAKDTKVSSVHRFRTNSRRVEALVSELAPESPNTKKLLKLLSKLRKRAGKLRDLDVQIAFLKEQRIPDRQNHCVQLLAALEEEQARRSKKLAKHFDKEKVSQLRKRLRRASMESIPSNWHSASCPSFTRLRRRKRCCIHAESLQKARGMWPNLPQNLQ
jgi:CHAD domain-containing protein